MSQKDVHKKFDGQIQNFPEEISEFGRQFFWPFFQKSYKQVKCEIQFYVDPENFMKNIEKPRN